MSSNFESTLQMFERIDFQTPRRPGSNSSKILDRWHRELTLLAHERWSSLISETITLSPKAITTATELMGLEQLPKNGIGVHVQLGVSSISSLVVMSGRLCRALVESVLNIVGDDWPPEERLTSGEMAVLEILFENIAESLGESWPGADSLPIRVVETVTKPHRVRLFPLNTNLLVVTTHVELRYGVEVMYWLLPQVAIEELISSEFGFTAKTESVSQSLAALAQRVPVDFIVELGQVEVRMTEVAELAIGDVLILDQSIHKLLTAYAAGEPKWKVAPVSLGTQLGVQVESLVASTD